LRRHGSTTRLRIPVRGWQRSGGLWRTGELTQHVRQDAAVPVVLALLRRQQQHLDLEALLAGGAPGDDLDFACRAVVETGGGAYFVAAQAERLRVLAGAELQRQHAHADEVRAVDTLEAFGDDRLDAEQHRAFCRPVARRAGAVLLAGD